MQNSEIKNDSAVGQLAVRAANDSSAAAELIALLLPSIRAMAKGIDARISEDLLQEGLLGALSAIGEFDADRGNARAYLLTCAKNKMLSSIKRNSLIGGFDEQSGEIPAPASAGDEYARHERLELLKEAVETRLTIYERDVVSMYLGGLSYREIAERLGADRKSVDNAMQRARKKLRAVLDEREDA